MISYRVRKLAHWGIFLNIKVKIKEFFKEIIKEWFHDFPMPKMFFPDKSYIVTSKVKELQIKFQKKNLNMCLWKDPTEKIIGKLQKGTTSQLKYEQKIDG